ncbi:hypothetical protein [Pelagibius sp.]|uniref:hypothetical protein n=1 Tax=Pelagibius sp. TaxID=1931238 RepID=UPI003BAEDF61
MTVKPILFSGPMVRAILDGRKTQTRRVLKPQPIAPWYWPGDDVDPDAGWFDRWEEGREPCGAPTREVTPPIKLPYAPGDLLWVRETWAINNCGRRVSLSADAWPEGWPVDRLQYMATSKATDWHFKTGEPHWWNSRPSIHMPRWASRLTLEVTDVRIERVQAISEEDAQSEGAEEKFLTVIARPDGDPDYHIPSSHRGGFAILWNSLNAKRGFVWDANPWVVAVTFKAHHRNVDSYCGASQP